MNLQVVMMLLKVKE